MVEWKVEHFTRVLCVQVMSNKAAKLSKAPCVDARNAGNGGAMGEWMALQCFGAVVLFFHTSEVALVLAIEPEEFSRRSFLVSWPYIVAMMCGVSEHMIWRALFGVSKRIGVWSGLGFVILGETIRKAAWLTARGSFTHLIKDRRRAQHRLVTHGVYAFARHPGYLGWLLWAVGTQVILGNVVCAVGFAIVAWRFFRERIPIEEWHLLRIFGHRYRIYRDTVPTRIPGIP